MIIVAISRLDRPLVLVKQKSYDWRLLTYLVEGTGQISNFLEDLGKLVDLAIEGGTYVRLSMDFIPDTKETHTFFGKGTGLILSLAV